MTWYDDESRTGSRHGPGIVCYDGHKPEEKPKEEPSDGPVTKQPLALSTGRPHAMAFLKWVAVVVGGGSGGLSCYLVFFVLSI